MNGWPLSWRMASWACAGSANSTNAKPRGRPVSRSTGMATRIGSATAAKCFFTSSSVAWYGRFPTNSLTDTTSSPSSGDRSRRLPSGPSGSQPGTEPRLARGARTRRGPPSRLAHLTWGVAPHPGGLDRHPYLYTVRIVAIPPPMPPPVGASAPRRRVFRLIAHC